MKLESVSPDATTLFRAVLNTERLELITHLSFQELSLPEISHLSKLQPKEIQHHLAILVAAKLVIVHEKDGIQLYRFNHKQLDEFNRLHFREAEFKHDKIDLLGFPEEKRKILTDYTNPDGSLKMIPTKSKKIMAILDYLILAFDQEGDFSEKQVNEILEGYHPDTTTLRRYLIDFGYLGRTKDGARYWRIIPEKTDQRN